MNETEQRYHSNKQEFLTLKRVVTEQFHEYLSPYGKNRNEFVVRYDNNPLTSIFSSANLDAAGQHWVACLASFNFSLEYQKGKDNTVADFLSWMNERLPEEEVQEYLDKIPYPGGGFIVESQLEDWPIYRVKCPTSDDRQKPKYWVLHWNHLLLVTNEDASTIPGQAQAEVTPLSQMPPLRLFQQE